MNIKNRQEAEQYVQTQKAQMGLDEAEAAQLLETTLSDLEEGEEPAAPFAPPDMNRVAPAAPAPAANRSRGGRKKMSADPYLTMSQTVKARPTRVSRIYSILYEYALPNEYIFQIGPADARPVLGGRFWKPGRRYLKFPAAVQTVYFTSDNANKNYQGLRVDGYACWKVDPGHPEVAARNLDFSNQENPMGNTNRILCTICTEAIRHIIANMTIEDALTKKDEIGRDLKTQLERIEKSWGITFDQVGIERVTILSAQVFEDLQQRARDDLRLKAAESRMATDQEIEKRKAQHTTELESMRCQTEKESRILKATTETQIHQVELDEETGRTMAERKKREMLSKAEQEALERSEVQQAEMRKRQDAREAEIAAGKEREEHALQLARLQNDTAARIRASEAETRIAEAETLAKLAASEAGHRITLQDQALAYQRSLENLFQTQQFDAATQAARLKLAAAQFRQGEAQRREAAALDQEIETGRIALLREREAIRNTISDNRVVEKLVHRLPEILSRITIDRYTVLDTAGGTPLTHTITQVLSLLKELEPKRKSDAETGAAERPGPAGDHGA